MKIITQFAFAALASFSAFQATAADMSTQSTIPKSAISHSTMHNPTMQQQVQQKVIQTEGVITAIDTKNKKLTITHEAIPQINWPAMTMRFTYENEALITGLKVDDKVAFGFVQQGNLSMLNNIASFK